MKLKNEKPELPAGYSICHAKAGHIPHLNDIELAAAAVFPQGSIPEHVLSDRVPVSVLTGAVEKARLWVALKDKDALPVGYALLRVEDGVALLAQIDVHPDHGQKGLGSALARRVIKAVHDMGLPALCLTTFATIPWNAPWYEKLGFCILPPEEQPPLIRDILKTERRHGLENRVAMILPLCERGCPG